MEAPAVLMPVGESDVLNNVIIPLKRSLSLQVFNVFRKLTAESR